MALLSGFDQIDTSTDSFSDWLTKTNELILLMRGDTVSGQTSVMTANSLPGGSQTFGNATLFGQFTSNTMVVLNNGLNDGSDDNVFANVEYGGLRGGIWDNVSNTITADTLYVVSNTTYTDESVEVYVNSTYGLIVENFIEARHDVMFVGTGGSNTNPQLHWQDSGNILQWNQDVRAVFGNNSGTEITGGTDQYEMFYSGDRFYSNTDVQDLRAQANLNFITDVLEVRSETDGEFFITANVNNGVVLYWDNSAKLTTNTHGIVVHGDTIIQDDLVMFDNNRIMMGGAYPYNGNTDIVTYNFQLYTDGTDGIIVSGDRDLNIFVHEGFNLTNEAGDVNFITANNDGSSEVILYNNGTARLETTGVETGEVPGVEIHGEANTDTLRVEGDANFDGSDANGDVTVLNSNNIYWESLANTAHFREETRLTFGDTDQWENFRLDGRSYSNTDIQDIRATANLNLVTDVFELKSETGNELFVTANVNNGVVLYWDNSAKLTTNTNGIYVHGDAIVEDDIVLFDNNRILMGGTSPYNEGTDIATYNFQIYTDGTDGIIVSGDKDLNIFVHEGFNLTNEAGNVNFITANNDGSSEVVLYNNGVARLETTGEEAGEVPGVEIHGEANTDTLRVTGDANFDGSTGLDSNNLFWDSSANTLFVRDDTTIEFGDGSDLTIWHDANTENSYITENNANGSLFVEGTNVIVRATDGSRYLEGIDGTATIIYSPDDTPAALANNNQFHITDLANTSTLRVRSTSLFEDNIAIEGSGSTNTLTWTKTSNTLNFDDNNFATFGTGGDLSIYHDGTNSFIADTGTGDTFILTNKLNVRNAANTENMIVLTEDAGVQLYYNNNQKLQTTNTGVDVEGEANTDTLRVQSDAQFENGGVDKVLWDASNTTFNVVDNTRITVGTGHDLRVYHDANNTFIENHTGELYVQGDGLTFRSANSESYIETDAEGKVTLFFNGASKFTTENTGADITGTLTVDGVTVDGNSVLNGNVDLGQGTSNTISFIGRVDTNIVPSTNNAQDLGSATLTFNDGFFGGTVSAKDVSVANTVTVSGDVDVTLDVTANNFVGNGALITSLNGSEVTTGTVAAARIDAELTSNTSGIAASANNVRITTSSTNANFRVLFGANTGTFRSVYSDAGLLYNPNNDTLTVNNFVATGSVTLPSEIEIATGTFTDISVANTATILNLEVTSLEANGVAFSGTGGDVSTSAATVIDVFPITQTQGYKYFVHGENLGSDDSGYAIEINVITTDNLDIYYTRYGEVATPNMDNISIVPELAANATHIELKATCPSANANNVHTFKVLKIETRNATT